MGVEEEFSNNFEKALNWYEESYIVLQETYCDDPLIVKFKAAHNKLKAVKNIKK